MSKILLHNSKVIDYNGFMQGPLMAYSVRKIPYLNYNSNCMRVRRSSDDTELDIGFIGNDLDTITLLSFVGSGNGFVTKWYDQSGNSNDVFQINISLQPQIINSGSLIIINNKPAIYSLAKSLNLASPIVIGKEYSFYGTLQFNTNGTEWLGGPNTNLYGMYKQDSIQTYHTISENPIFYYFLFNLSNPINVQNIYSINRNNNTTTLRINETTAITNGVGGYNFDFILFSLMSESGGGAYQNGYLQETIIYNKNKASVDSKIYDNIKNYFQ